MNCALCSDHKGGFLPCNKDRHGTKPSQCPDDQIMRTRKYWKHSEGKWGSIEERYGGHCKHLHASAAMLGLAETTWSFPGIGKGSLVLTKTWVTHPGGSHKSVGVVIFKRLVTHTCSGERPRFCKKGVTVADVHKVGYCVKCHYSVFGSMFARKAKTKHRKSFVKRCLPKAIDQNGNVKPAFQCDPENLKFAKASIVGF